MDSSRDRWFAAAILLAAALLFFARLGDRAITSEESRWAQIAREMRQSGDWFRPTINGQPYYDKPVASYWLIVLASYLTGAVDETAARLPAAIAGWLGVWLTMSLGRRLYDARTGLLAGAILASSFGFVFYARRATADAETVTGVLAAIWLYAKHRDGGGPWLLGLWSIMALTSLTKGLLGFALPIAVFAVDSAWTGFREQRSWRGVVRQPWLFDRWSLAAVPLGLTIFVTPFAASILASQSNDAVDLLVRENVRRFFAPHNHVGPVYLYAGAIFLLLAPWSLYLPAALISSQRTPGHRLALVSFWTIFAFFTLAASRRAYYLLPILPATSLLVARVLLADQVSVWTTRLRIAAQWCFAGVTILAGVLLLSPADVLPPPWDALPPLPQRGILAAGWLGLVATQWLLRSRFTMVATGFAGMSYLFLIAIPELNDGADRRAFVREVRERVDFTTLSLFHSRDAAFDLAAPNPLAEHRDAASLERDLREGKIVWVLARRRALRDDVLSATIALEEAIPPWEKQSGDRLVLLKAYRVMRAAP